MSTAQGKRRQLPLFGKLNLADKMLVAAVGLLAGFSLFIIVSVQLLLEYGSRSGDIEELSRALNLGLGFVLVGLIVAGALAARSVSRYVTAHVAELTRLADEVSVGNLDVEFDFGVPVRCWEIKGCHRVECAAYGDTVVQCWFVDGTPCEGYEPRFPEKLAGCRTCEVYRAHKGDEIVQLADSFHHMARSLSASQLELQQSNRFQRGLIHNSFDGIIATDHDDVVRTFNRVATHLTGFEESEVVGKMTWDELFASHMCEELPLFQDGTRTVFGFYRKELALFRKDETTAAVLASGITLQDSGSDVGKVFFFKDLREIHQLREDLVRSERLAATGQTVASISHSIKNILDGLRGGVYIYKRGERLADLGELSEGWSMVERNIELISALVADLLNYAKDREPELRPTDLNDLVADVARGMEPKADSLAVRLHVDLDPDLEAVRLDAHTMHQCLTNLITNSLDATANEEDGWVKIGTSRARDGRFEVVVRDNGPGVAAEVLDELFTGMVSTKGSKGTGLGLLVVRKIIDEHGGEVVYDDGTDGATFRVLLPT